MPRSTEPRDPMSAEEFSAALALLDLTPNDASRLLDVDYTRVLKWRSGASDVSPMAALILRYLIGAGVYPERFLGAANPLDATQIRAGLEMAATRQSESV